MNNMPILPTLIFAENHHDPVTGKILVQLVPELKKMGYECFFDEMPSSTTINSHLETIESNKELWKKLAVNLKDGFGIDIHDTDQLKHPFFSKQPGEKLLYFINRHPAALSFEPFLKLLDQLQVAYHGMDDEKTQAKRDKQMSETLIRNKNAAFSRVGRNHVHGIQTEILKVLDEKSASDQFCFFDIHSTKFAEWSSDKRNFDLEVVSLDVSKKNEEEIVTIILNQIIEKQKALNAKPIIQSIPSKVGKSKSIINDYGLINGIGRLFSVFGIFASTQEEFLMPQNKSASFPGYTRPSKPH